MKILFLSNNNETYPLYLWIKSQGVSVELISEPLKEIDNADLFVSYGYRHIIPASILDLHPGKFINLHISYLPFNRGADPLLWAVLDGTQAGVSIHLIDPGIDTGPIIAQEKFELSDNETLKTAYEIMQSRIQGLFKSTWPSLINGSYSASPQKNSGTYHSIREGLAVKNLLLTEGYKITLAELKRRYAESNSTMLSGDVFR